MDNIATRRLDNGLDRGREVPLVITYVDHRRISADPFAESCLLARWYRCNDPRTHSLGQFGCRSAHTIGGARDRNRFSPGRAGLVLQRVTGCAIGEGKAGGRVKWYGVGDPNDRVLVKADMRCVATERGQSQDAVTRRRGRDIRADGRNFAGDIAA